MTRYQENIISILALKILIMLENIKGIGRIYQQTVY